MQALHCCRLRAHHRRRCVGVRESDRHTAQATARRSAGGQALESRASVCAEDTSQHAGYFCAGDAGWLSGRSEMALPFAVRAAVTGPGQLIGRPLPPTPRASRFRGPLPHLHLHLHLLAPAPAPIAHCTSHAAPLPYLASPRLASSVSPPLHSAPALALAPRPPTHARFWFARPWALCDIAPLVSSFATARPRTSIASITTT